MTYLTMTNSCIATHKLARMNAGNKVVEPLRLHLLTCNLHVSPCHQIANCMHFMRLKIRVEY